MERQKNNLQKAIELVDRSDLSYVISFKKSETELGEMVEVRKGGGVVLNNMVRQNFSVCVLGFDERLLQTGREEVRGLNVFVG